MCSMNVSRARTDPSLRRYTNHLLSYNDHTCSLWQQQWNTHKGKLRREADRLDSNPFLVRRRKCGSGKWWTQTAGLNNNRTRHWQKLIDQSRHCCWPISAVWSVNFPAYQLTAVVLNTSRQNEWWCFHATGLVQHEGGTGRRAEVDAVGGLKPAVPSLISITPERHCVPMVSIDCCWSAEHSTSKSTTGDVKSKTTCESPQMTLTVWRSP